MLEICTVKRKTLKFESLENRCLMVSDWMNTSIPLDVNSSGEVTPLDALLVVNEIQQRGSRVLPALGGASTIPALVDVNGDGAVSPLDALNVVNALRLYNVQPTIEFEKQAAGESGMQFSGRTLPNTKVVVEQLAAVLPLQWTFVADANGEFEGLNIGPQGMAVRATVTDPLGRKLTQDLVFKPGQAEPELTQITSRGPQIGDVAPEVRF